MGEGQYAVSCDSKEWQEVWRDYFDLGRDYAGLRRRAAEKQKDCFIARAMECGCGLRVLHQDPWEMLVTFIISQRKNIPAISRAVELLARRYGHSILAGGEEPYSVVPTTGKEKPHSMAPAAGKEKPYSMVPTAGKEKPYSVVPTTGKEKPHTMASAAGDAKPYFMAAGAEKPYSGKSAPGTIQSFPTPEELARASEADLRDCGLGYRAAYVRDAVEKVLSGELDLKAIGAYEDEKLFQELMKVHGVGKKVADCVCLFGYSRSSRTPVDVWIARAIQEECRGRNPFPDYGEDAGIIQQYIFYYQKHQST